MSPAGRMRLPGPRIPCDPEFDVAVPAELGEGPRWDAATATLLWVDILGRAVHRYDPATGRDEVAPVPALVGFALPRARGGVVLGLPDGLWLLRGRRRRASCSRIEADVPGNRLNDGACDPQGRLWAGTMALDERSPTAGALPRRPGPERHPDARRDDHLERARLEPGRRPLLLHRHARRGASTCSTSTRRRGAIEHRRPLAAVERRGRRPDGLTVDAEGCVWVALHGGWGLLRYSPEGELLGRRRACRSPRSPAAASAAPACGTCT